MEIQTYIFCQNESLAKQLNFPHFLNIQPDFQPQYDTVVYSTFNSETILRSTLKNEQLDLQKQQIYKMCGQNCLFVQKLDQLKNYKVFEPLYNGLNLAKTESTVLLQQPYQIILLLKLNEQNLQKIQKVSQLFGKLQFLNASLSSSLISEELPLVIISPEKHKKAQQELINSILEARKQFQDIKNMQFPETNDSMIQANDEEISPKKKSVLSQSPSSQNSSNKAMTPTLEEKQSQLPPLFQGSYIQHQLQNSDVKSLQHQVISPIQGYKECSQNSEVDILAEVENNLDVLNNEELQDIIKANEQFQNEIINDSKQSTESIMFSQQLTSLNQSPIRINNNSQSQLPHSPYNDVQSRLKDVEIILQMNNNSTLQQSLFVIQELIDDIRLNSQQDPKVQENLTAYFNFQSQDVKPENVIYLTEVEQIIKKHQLCYSDSLIVLNSAIKPTRQLRTRIQPLQKIGLMLDASYYPIDKQNLTGKQDVIKAPKESSPIVQNRFTFHHTPLNNNSSSQLKEKQLSQNTKSNEYQYLDYNPDHLQDMSLIEAQTVRALQQLGDKLEYSVNVKEEALKSGISFNYDDLYENGISQSKNISPVVAQEFNDIKSELHLIKDQVSQISQKVKDSSIAESSFYERQKYAPTVQRIHVPAYKGDSLLDRVHKARKNILDIRQSQ
ncbi:hypothetical protein SS50377_25594 [Spironucleus salmonicida]|uniref:Uncharacterized protein n=1 Tax=Spironucleus salmonicida TaxID=348837 RepID=V6LKG9_9EUKA|nr:hypothetical protein SS50377_25594 [Spironucleus salmonicida]|eukprot:EST45140.1 Hypothetical protein SS50377_15162 [Spironucleus salmonicida]